MTISTDLRLALPGTPAGKGSMRCVGTKGRHQLIPDNAAAAKAWAAQLAAGFRAIRRKYPDQHAGPGQAIAVEVTLTVSRPAGHYGTGRNAGKLKPSCRDAYPVPRGTGDVDKLARLVLDEAQNAGILADDAQVIYLAARKVYTEDRLSPDALDYPGAVVRFSPYRGE